MRGTIRMCVLALLLPLGAAAQETRGNISGTVRDSAGVVPGASVTITNVDTKVSQTLTTNDTGYFEAPLLNAGNYQVTVRMDGFSAATRNNIVLGGGQQLNVPFTLEVGAVSEEIVVRAEAPLLDTNTVSSGGTFETRLVDSLPMFSNMPITLARFAPGVNVNDQQTQVSQGYVDNTSLSAGSALGLPLAGTQNPATPQFGGNNYTIDGASNNGSNRRIAQSPNSDMVQEMRVESSNFDASVGHGLGLQISMMTRAGTNAQRGTANYQFWSNKLNSLTAQQQATFDDRAKSEFRRAARKHGTHQRRARPHSRAGRRPRQAVLLRQLLVRERRHPGQDPGDAHRAGQRETLAGRLLGPAAAPNPVQYQLYDPLTTRPDPANPGRMIRDRSRTTSFRATASSIRTAVPNPLMDAVRAHGAEAEPELPRERTAARQQLLSGRRARLAGEPPVRRPDRLQPHGQATASSSAAAASPSSRTSATGDISPRTRTCASTRPIARATSGRARDSWTKVMGPTSSTPSFDQPLQPDR